MKSQREEVLSHLQKKGSITSMTAFKRYDITRLSSVIFQLRRAGFQIKTLNIVKKHWLTGRTMQYGKYILLSKKAVLPKYWAVKNDGSQLFKDTVIKYLNEHYKLHVAGISIGYYYGTDIREKIFLNAWCHLMVKDFNTKPKVFTIQEFINLTAK